MKAIASTTIYSTWYISCALILSVTAWLKFSAIREPINLTVLGISFNNIAMYAAIFECMLLIVTLVSWGMRWNPLYQIGLITTSFTGILIGRVTLLKEGEHCPCLGGMFLRFNNGAEIESKMALAICLFFIISGICLLLKGSYIANKEYDKITSLLPDTHVKL